MNDGKTTLLARAASGGAVGWAGVGDGRDLNC